MRSENVEYHPLKYVRITLRIFVVEQAEKIHFLIEMIKTNKIQNTLQTRITLILMSEW